MKFALFVFVASLIISTECFAEEKLTEASVYENKGVKKEIVNGRQDVLPIQKTTVKSNVEKNDTSDELIFENMSSTAEVKQEASPVREVDIPEEKIEEIVVTATRTKQSIKDVGSSISVVTHEDIEERKAPLILDVLRQVPGIEVTRTQGIGGTTSIFMRGGNASHTLVFIDGVQVNSPTTNEFNFANLTTDNIERIEVLRGPQSTLYGSEAIGGVINIITKKGKGPPTVSLGTEIGMQDTYRERINVSGGESYFDYSVGGSYLKTRGISNASSGTERDGYENITGSARLGFHFMDDGRIDTSVRSSFADFDLDGFQSGFGPVDDPDRTQTTDEIFFSTKVVKTFFDVWTPSFLVSVMDNDTKGRDPTNESAQFGIFTRVWRAEHQSDITIFDIDTITFGYEYEVREGKSEGKFDKTMRNNAVFFQNQIELFDSFHWTVGFRSDKNSLFGSYHTYRTTGSYNIEAISTRFHSSWGKGFKAPSLNELFFPNFGNSDLDPEKSYGWDIGIEHEFMKDVLTIDITYFKNNFRDLISFARQSDGSFRAINVGMAKAEGYEVSLTYSPLETLVLSGTYTYDNTRNGDVGQQLPRRPRHKVTLGVNARPLEKLHVNFTGSMVRDRIDSDGTEMDNYWLANAVTRYEVTRLMTMYVRLENMFDYDYEEVTGFKSLPFVAYAGIDFTF